MSFVQEFRKNIPYLVDELFWDITNIRHKTTPLQSVIEESLNNWISEYQTDEAQSLFDKENEFPQEDFEL